MYQLVFTSKFCYFSQITGVQTNEGGDYYIFESLSAGLISAENYSKWMNIPDRWFVGNTDVKTRSNYYILFRMQP